MKLLSTVYQLNHLTDILAHADGVILGHASIGTRLTQSFSIQALTKAIQTVKKMNKEVFIQANRIFNDSELAVFRTVVSNLPLSSIDGIIIADLGAYGVLSHLGYADKVVYNPETLITNVYDFNYYATFGIKGVYVAKEITLEDIERIGTEKKQTLFMVGHGHLNMFYSKRQLIDTYATFQEIKDHHFHNSQHLRLIEETRPEENYPVLEDDAGTHVFRSQVFSCLDDLKTLEPIVDYLIIDTIFKDDAYAMKVLPMYQKENPDETIIVKIKQTYQESWDQGFLYKKTIYKTRGNHD